MAGPVVVVGLTSWCGFFVKRGIPPTRAVLFPVVDEVVGIDNVDVWLLLDDGRELEITGDWDIFDIERAGTTLRLATAGVGDAGASGIDDVEFVMDDVGCACAVTDNGAAPVFFIWFVVFLDVDGAGIIVGRRIPPTIVVDTKVFSGLDGDDRSLIEEAVWVVVDGNGRGFDWGFTNVSVDSPSDIGTS